jgi:arginyl-tRNA synthetase
MQDMIRIELENAIKTLGWPTVDFVVDYPTDKNAGADVFSNVALVLSKQVGQNPREVAEQIRQTIDGKIELVDAIEVAGPGFLNFSLNRVYFKTALEGAIAAGEQWGRNTVEAGQQVIVEYTSPNLFKPLHVGNLVGNIIGESFTRLFELAGANVVRANYPSDIGLPVAKAVWGLQKSGNDPDKIEELGAAYRIGNEAYEAEGVEKEEIIAINQTLYAGSDDELSQLRLAGIATSNKQINAICEKLGTHFDIEIFESQAAPVGLEIVKENIGTLFTESEGAIVYDGERSGLHTRVFLNSKGLPTYEAKDIGHYKLKHDQYPNWNKSIIVTGGEQSEYFKVVYAAIKELFPEASEKHLEHIPTGFLTLNTGKMSSRKGNVLTGESIITSIEAAAKEKMSEHSEGDDALATQVAVAALKYEILRHGIGSNIVFDKEKALSFEGASGPYLQYTYARIQSVLVKAIEAGVKVDTTVAPSEAYKIEKMIEAFPAVVQTALADRAPQALVTYLTELASEFNSFYAQEKIADASDQFAPYKAAVAATVGSTLKQGLWALGIEAPERM